MSLSSRSHYGTSYGTTQYYNDPKISLAAIWDSIWTLLPSFDHQLGQLFSFKDSSPRNPMYR